MYFQKDLLTNLHHRRDCFVQPKRWLEGIWISLVKQPHYSVNQKSEPKNHDYILGQIIQEDEKEYGGISVEEYNLIKPSKAKKSMGTVMRLKDYIRANGKIWDKLYHVEFVQVIL